METVKRTRKTTTETRNAHSAKKETNTDVNKDLKYHPNFFIDLCYIKCASTCILSYDFIKIGILNKKISFVMILKPFHKYSRYIKFEEPSSILNKDGDLTPKQFISSYKKELLIKYVEITHESSLTLRRLSLEYFKKMKKQTRLQH